MKNPIISEKINLEYTSGVYAWYIKTVVVLYNLVMPILNQAKKAYTSIQYASLVSALWVVNHMSLKLEGICSISSSVHDNSFCSARRKIKDCICAFCYAHNQQARHTGLKEHNILNGIILRNVLIPVKYFKLLKIVFPYIRIESFGDVANVIQARNYIRIIKAFPEKRCAIWSKNILIWEQAFKLEGKPKNTTYVHSSSKLNKPDNIDLNRFNFIDHIFTVFDADFIRKNNVKINCGGRKCMDCIKAKKGCYFRNTELYINEQKK